MFEASCWGLSKHYIDIWEHDYTIIDQKITMSPRVNEKLWQNENLQIIYARNLNYSIYWWKKCQLIKISKINGFKLYQIYICWNIRFCKEFKKPDIFCCWCVLELVVLYEGMINMVILPYLSRLLVLIQNVDELSSRPGWLTDWLTHTDTSHYTFSPCKIFSPFHGKNLIEQKTSHWDLEVEMCYNRNY